MFKVLNKYTLKSFQTSGKNSILEDGLDSGLNFPYSCKDGLCGKCKTLILDGEVVYNRENLPALSKQDIEANMILLCQCRAMSDLVINVAELDDLENIKIYSMVCKAVSINHLNHDVLQILLKTSKSDGLEYLAGQYIDIQYADFSPRSFSIANAPNDSGIIELHVRLVEDGVFTNFLFNSFKEKSVLKIEGPKGEFFLRKSDKDIIFVAGGTGFGPIKAIIEDMIAKKIKRKIYLYWGVRDKQDIYSDIPKKWAEEFSNIEYIPVLSEAKSSWQGATGFVHKKILQDFNDLSSYEVYACGPPVMVKAAWQDFLHLGLKKENFFSDAFEYSFIKK